MTRPYFRTAIFQRPENGNLAMPFEIDFSIAALLNFDLTQELMTEAGLGFVQGVFIDNAASIDPLTLTFSTPANQGFPLRVPSKVQTWQPLLIPIGDVRFSASSVQRGQKVQVQLVNFPVQPIMWNVP